MNVKCTQVGSGIEQRDSCQVDGENWFAKVRGAKNELANVNEDKPKYGRFFSHMKEFKLEGG